MKKAMRGLKLIDGDKEKETQVHRFGGDGENPEDRKPNPAKSKSKSKSDPNKQCPPSNPSAAAAEKLLPFGLPVADQIEPQIDPHIRHVDLVNTLADLRRAAASCAVADRSGQYLRHCAAFRGLSDPRMFRRSLRLARRHAVDPHAKVVLAAWLRFERRDGELELFGPSCCGRNVECPRATLVSGYDPESVNEPCACVKSQNYENESEQCSTMGIDDSESDMSFCIGGSEIRCRRNNIASLSTPFRALLFGCFRESNSNKIDFSNNGISPDGMRFVEIFSRTKKLCSLDTPIVLEILSLANKFCCEEMKSACDAHLASLVVDMDSAVVLMEYGLEESAYLSVAACLQVFFRNLPTTLHNPNAMKFFFTEQAREKLELVGHGTFLLYHFLSQVAMEEDMRSNKTVMLLEQAMERATLDWQKQVAFHQLGVVLLGRNEFNEASRCFETAAEAGHVYSRAGLARARHREGNTSSAYDELSSVISGHNHNGWMYQERSLYCDGLDEKRMGDLYMATELDPALVFPYKYRAVALMLEGENRIGAALSEINKVINFKVSADCLELRAWISIVLKDYEGALRDVRTILTLEPNYKMFHGKMAGDCLVQLLRPHVKQSCQADCWMQLYDRWSSVDDIGSLAVVHQMLENEPENSLVRFRQSLLLLRMNCQRAAMRSLRLARYHSNSEHERLVYEGWILYDTGHREEALDRADKSIAKQRSFEAFFLKAYVLADSCLDADSSNYVIHLLEEALKCPSDGLRKGQALNNLGSVYVDCDKLDLAARCYTNALDIKHTRAHQGLARVYHLKNRGKAAYDEMTKLIEKSRSNASAYEKRSEYCDRKMARNDLRMATELDPLRTYPYKYRAAVLMDAQKGDEAIAELTKAITFKPDLQLLHLRAAFHEMAGDYASAIRDCEAALCFDPNHTDTLKLYNKTREQIVSQRK